MTNEVRSSLRRLLCLIGIHHYSVPKKYREMRELGLRGQTLKMYTILLSGCTVPGCCKIQRIKVEH